MRCGNWREDFLCAFLHPTLPNLDKLIINRTFRLKATLWIWSPVTITNRSMTILKTLKACNRGASVGQYSVVDEFDTDIH